MNSHILNVWLHGEHLGELQRLRNGANRLRFDADALRRWAPDDLVAEATTWGLSERAARDILDESAQATLAALDAVPGGPLTDPVREAAAQRIRSAGLR